MLSGVPFELGQLSAYLTPLLVKEPGKDQNLKACLRVASKLISGEGVTHKAKPAEVFRGGQPITLDMDFDSLAGAQRVPFMRWPVIGLRPRYGSRSDLLTCSICLEDDG